MTAALDTVGFIGVGHMGRPMAQRLLDAGHPLVVLDASSEHCEHFASQEHVTIAANGGDLAAQAKYIITMLPNSQIVDTILTQPNGVLSALQGGTILIEMSSGVPRHTQALAKLTHQAGGFLLDAPVSGGVSRAQTGELSIMVGGEAQPVQQARPLLERMGNTVTHTGPVGTAHAMKALNNLLSAGGFMLGIEVLLIGQRFGLDPEVMINVLNTSTGMNNSTQKKFKQFVLSRRFDSGFSLGLMVKDLSIALGLAADSATATPLASLCNDLWSASANMLGGDQDHTAAARLVEILNASELSSGSSAQ